MFFPLPFSLASRREAGLNHIISRQPAALSFPLLKPAGLAAWLSSLLSSTSQSKSNHTAVSMERVQHMTKSAIRRASQIEVNPQAKRNLQELFVNFTLILICLLLIYIIVLLSSWEQRSRRQTERESLARLYVDQGLAEIWALLISTQIRFLIQQ